MRVVFVLLLATALAGCAVSRLSNDVKPFVGKNVHELTARLGSPNGKRETSGAIVYVWSLDSDGVLSNGTGALGARDSTTTVQLECTLEVTVNERAIIQDYQVDGSNAGCGAFRHRLRR